MKLAVYVLGRDVARLEQSGDFKSVLTYHADVVPDDFVSLTMPVRSESWVWDDQLHPVFQMNLPEGHLLKVLQEQFGPHVGADPAALLAVIGRNMIGRVQVAAPGAVLDAPAKAFELAEVLRGDNSEQAFDRLVRAHAASGVSGVVPKFLDEEVHQLRGENKARLVTRKHIIKGSSAAVPFVAINEHLCLQVARRVMPTARTELSDDGRALVVHRFDVDAGGRPRAGMEDFCALLGMRPAAKYETTWERIAKSLRAHVPPAAHRDAFMRLTQTLLLTYALRNADCHSKNIALLYTSRRDVALAPAFDLVTTSVYADYRDNPPGISFQGKKTWSPGKTLERFITATFGVEARHQRLLVEQISDAVSEVAPEVRAMMRRHPAFEDLGRRMLGAWREGIESLRSKRSYGLGAWAAGASFEVPTPKKQRPTRRVVGRSPLLGRRRGR